MANIIQRLLAGEIERPKWYWAFVGAILGYFVVTAGIAYDIINEPPAIGGHPDPRTGAVRPQASVKGSAAPALESLPPECLPP